MLRQQHWYGDPERGLLQQGRNHERPISGRVLSEEPPGEQQRDPLNRPDPDERLAFA